MHAYMHCAEVTLLVEKVEDPRMYGVIIRDEIDPHVLRVKKVIEKPRKPPSNLATIALYLFKPIIFKTIEEAKPDESGEVQLADALQVLIDWKCKLYALELRPDERRIDIGTPETYLKILKMSLATV